MERQIEKWSCVHDIRLVTVTDHGRTHWRVLSIPGKAFFSITTFQARRYPSLVTSAYIASWKFDTRRDTLESLVGMDWVEPISLSFSLTGASHHIFLIKEKIFSVLLGKRKHTTHPAAEGCYTKRTFSARLASRSPTVTASARVALLAPIFGQPDAVTSHNGPQIFLFDSKRRVLTRSRHYITRCHNHQSLLHSQSRAPVPNVYHQRMVQWIPGAWFWLETRKHRAHNLSCDCTYCRKHDNKTRKWIPKTASWKKFFWGSFQPLTRPPPNTFA